ncbi:MAG: NimC/NimA family protein [Anaerocolumna sp.]|jgi:uncharacterized pyridoxamine 5'-phosphate oxidase family protein|nr:NimC/NimA family protein [Anaerocolumna sp.]
MNKAASFLNECKIFYISTIEDDKPRVRPFGAIMEWENRTYICTNNKKDFYKQIQKNPNFEISATNGGSWIRLSGKLVTDPRVEAKEAMLLAYPPLRDMYRIDDGIYEVLYITDGTATINTIGGTPEVITL